MCLKRHVEGQPGAFGSARIVGILKDRPLPHMGGVAGAAFCIYHGEVNEDSDGPIEWCRPVPQDRAEEIAARVPRARPAHRDRTRGSIRPPGQGTHHQLCSAAANRREPPYLGAEHGRQPSELGARVMYLTTPPVTPESVPECDFAVPVLQVVMDPRPSS